MSGVWEALGGLLIVVILACVVLVAVSVINEHLARRDAAWEQSCYADFNGYPACRICNRLMRSHDITTLRNHYAACERTREHNRFREAEKLHKAAIAELGHDVEPLSDPQPVKRDRSWVLNERIDQVWDDIRLIDGRISHTRDQINAHMAAIAELKRLERETTPD